MPAQKEQNHLTKIQELFMVVEALLQQAVGQQVKTGRMEFYSSEINVFKQFLCLTKGENPPFFYFPKMPIL